MSASLLYCVLLAFPVDRKDILVADFEGSDYAGWIAEGEAFGTAPAKGTLKGQMPVTGYLGKGLVNSFVGGDDSVGTLTSPEFTVERRFLHFLIGGGNYPSETCINLIVDKKTVRTATGPNDRPGGSEQLDWHSWDVSDLAGKTAHLQIVDRRKGGWGHINVDHIIQSDTKKITEPAQREIVIDKRFLHLPVKTGAANRRMKVLHNDAIVREYEIELAPGKPDFITFLDVTPWKGKTLVIRLNGATQVADLDAVKTSDAIPDADALYSEKHRPQFHFTSRRGWLNDPNGLVFYKAEYHLFYQHNPYGWNWGNMHWGHAVSKDLLHWEELPIALYPKRFGDWAFSGSAVVDAKNTAGFKTGAEDPLVLAYTSTGRGECIAYSNDKGRTWTEYQGNPVLKHPGRDPKLLWHAPTSQWVMAVYDEAKGRNISFHTSPDLKTWKYQSRIDGFYECPDLFELPLEGDAKTKKWVLYAADGQYLVGQFDGKSFHSDGGKQRLWFGNFYAAQTFNDAPEGRRIQIGWGQGIVFPGMPFNQQMTIPVELTLRPTPDGPRMFAEPIKELKTLHQGEPQIGNLMLAADKGRSLDVKADLMRIRAEFTLRPATGNIGFKIRGVPVVFDACKQTLTCGAVTAPLSASKHLQLEILVDRGSIEVFANHGRVAISRGGILPQDQPALAIVNEGDDTAVRYEVNALRSAWKR